MNNKPFQSICIRGMIDDDSKPSSEGGFIVSRDAPAESIIKRFTDCSEPELLDASQKLNLLVSVFESTYGVA